MSISTEIARLQQAKSDLATSIENKGVTVPSSATLDDYPALVDSISGGGIDLADIFKDYVSVVTPYGAGYSSSYAYLFNFQYGHKYKIIAKIRKKTADRISMYVYQGNANSPNVTVANFLSSDTSLVKEFTYTHNQSATYDRIGAWSTVSGERNSNYAIAVYIKEIE